MLLVDHADTYGSEYASFCLTAFQDGRLTPAEPEAQTPGGNNPCDQLPEESPAGVDTSGWRQVALPAPEPPFLNTQQHLSLGWSNSSSEARKFILDLAPKVSAGVCMGITCFPSLHPLSPPEVAPPSTPPTSPTLLLDVAPSPPP